MATDRFGNPLAAGLPYARGTILRSTEDDFTKLRQAWQIIRARIQKDGADSVFNFTGLERGLRIDPSDVPFLDDEIAPALFGERLTELALEHLGGRADRHDVMVFNRLNAATLTAQRSLVKSSSVLRRIVPRAYGRPAARAFPKRSVAMGLFSSRVSRASTHATPLLR